MFTRGPYITEGKRKRLRNLELRDATPPKQYPNVLVYPGLSAPDRLFYNNQIKLKNQEIYDRRNDYADMLRNSGKMYTEDEIKQRIIDLTWKDPISYASFIIADRDPSEVGLPSYVVPTISSNSLMSMQTIANRDPVSANANDFVNSTYEEDEWISAR